MCATVADPNQKESQSLSKHNVHSRISLLIMTFYSHARCMQCMDGWHELRAGNPTEESFAEHGLCLNEAAADGAWCKVMKGMPRFIHSSRYIRHICTMLFVSNINKPLQMPQLQRHLHWSAFTNATAETSPALIRRILYVAQCPGPKKAKQSRHSSKLSRMSEIGCSSRRASSRITCAH